jgi:lysine-ketoglutarate reductase/saccharopine dehydrogenase-like protein (TIGR00300 family)
MHGKGIHILRFVFIISARTPYHKEGFLMAFEFPRFTPPDFSGDRFKNAPVVKTSPAEKDGIAPEHYHSTSIYPEYFKTANGWVLAEESRMDCTAVLRDSGKVDIVEFRNLKKGDNVILGRKEDGSEGIFVYTGGFMLESSRQLFSFRQNRSRETAYSKDYDNLYELLRHERDHGYVVWVLGPAVVFDFDSRNALSALIENGYVHAILAGNAMATHDLEAGLFKTALGQDIYTQESVPDAHYKHLDLINLARREGSIEKIIKDGYIKDGIVYSAVMNNIPLVLAGSIRDDGPLPGVIHNVYEAQDEMRKHTKKATTLICLATQLHTIATGNMTPAYTIVDGVVRPVYIYCVDVAEFAVNKLRDRGTLEVTTIVTNVQDFLCNLKRNLT